MTEEFYGLKQFADYLGITQGALSNLNLPEPDARIGKVRGWKLATIKEWNANRPGRGNWGNRK